MSKPPAFQFYANDFMDATRLWDANAVGLYVRCMCIQWTQGSIPADMKLLARAIHCDRSELEACWPVLSTKFIDQGDGTLKNSRLEEVRDRQKTVSGKRSDAANARWSAHANAKQKDIQRKVKEKEKVEDNSGEKERAKVEPESDIDFEALWVMYERYGSKAKALAYWRRLPQADRDAVLAKAGAYVHSTPGCQYRKQLEGWINPENRLWERPIPKAVTTKPDVSAPMRRDQPVRSNLFKTLAEQQAAANPSKTNEAA